MLALNQVKSLKHTSNTYMLYRIKPSKYTQTQTGMTVISIEGATL